MSQMKHSTHAVTLEVPFDKAFDYLSNWHNQPKWAINFVKGIRKEGEQIIMTTPFGDTPIQWRTNHELGTIDIVFPGDSVLPTRLIAIGDSLVYTFTFSVPSDMPEEGFRASQHGMEEELATLKQILES